MKLSDFMGVLALGMVFWRFTILLFAIVVVVVILVMLSRPDPECLHKYRIIKNPITREPYLICKTCGEEEQV